jgi:hypothetical protein
MHCLWHPDVPFSLALPTQPLNFSQMGKLSPSRGLLKQPLRSMPRDIIPQKRKVFHLPAYIYDCQISKLSRGIGSL